MLEITARTIYGQVADLGEKFQLRMIDNKIFQIVNIETGHLLQIDEDYMSDFVEFINTTYKSDANLPAS